MNSFKHGVSAFSILVLSATSAFADAQSQAIRLFDRIAGVPIQLSDPRLAQMTAKIAAGDMMGAAAIASDDDNFYNITLVHVAAPLTNTNHDPVVPLQDLQALMVGVARDNIDARELLTGNYIYIADPAKVTTVGGTNIQGDTQIYRSNTHFGALETGRINLRQNLIQAPQKAYPSNQSGAAAMNLTDAGGVLSTRAWSSAYHSAGTNRRAFAFTMEHLLCSPLNNVRDAMQPDNRVHRDVDRQPGGNVSTYLNTCRSCHAGMDGMGGSLAYFDWDPNNGGNIMYTPGTVAKKLNQNGTVYPTGYITTDDSWLNYWVNGQNAVLGWSSSVPTQGKGLNAFGQMMANSRAYASCMVKHAFTEVCRRAPGSNDDVSVNSLTDDFISSGYKLRHLFEKAAVLPSCLGN